MMETYTFVYAFPVVEVLARAVGFSSFICFHTLCTLLHNQICNECVVGVARKAPPRQTQQILKRPAEAFVLAP